MNFKFSRKIDVILQLMRGWIQIAIGTKKQAVGVLCNHSSCGFHSAGFSVILDSLKVEIWLEWVWWTNGERSISLQTIRC